MPAPRLGSTSRSRPLSPRLAAAAVVAATVLASTSAFGAGQAPGSAAVSDRSPVGPSRAERSAASTTPDARGSYDVRALSGGRAQAVRLQRAAQQSARPATRSLRASIGRNAVLDIDGSTGTIRSLADLDGALTPTSKRSPQAVVSAYLGSHHDALGLSSADLGTLHLERSWTDVAGITHLSYVQQTGGLQVFGNGLTAAVDRSGRLLMLGGSPVSSVRAAPPSRGTDRVTTASGAIGAVRRLAGEGSTRPGPQDVAEQVLMVTPDRTYRAWRTITMSADQPALSVVDSTTGALLYRRSLSSDANAASEDRPSGDRPSANRSGGKASKLAGVGLGYSYFPGHQPRGGVPERLDFAKLGWLTRNANRLAGNNTHTWSDVVDDDRAQASEEVRRKTGHKWTFRLQPFKLPGVSFCGDPYPCSWNPNKPFSWLVNRKQNATQVFVYVNRWHDHLAAAPIGFTEAAGNFQQRNKTKAGEPGDSVRAQTDDGANSDHGLPDGSHVDNANMNTPPDGMSPTMQMYLQHAPGTSYPDGDPFAPTNVGDEADTVYHEYTHGLSNRLVVDADGQSTLGGVQAGAMGEGWSDWYAMDYLVAQKLQKDVKNKANIVLFQYDGAGTDLDRTEPIDCAVGDSSSLCNGAETGHAGGYTYRDYGRVIGSPEVHADGEIWAQALWALRDRIGSTNAEAVVTRAMSLAPANPSFLDMRNAILLADQAMTKGKRRTAIYAVFAKRGMGFYAGSIGGDDTTPAADFHTKPISSATGRITGLVTDQATGDPVAGVPVTLAFQGSGQMNPTVLTDADGRYSLGPVPVGPYGKLTVNGAGYEPTKAAVTVTTGTAKRDFVVRRDWAASSGGGTIASFTGPDYSPQCGPGGAIDLNQASGWGSTTGDDNGDPTGVFVAKNIVVKLPRPVDVSAFGVDPSATCGDGGSASTGAYQIETSRDGKVFTKAASGAFTAADRGRINEIAPKAGGASVSYVRFTILGNQTPDFATTCPGGAYSGCSYTDLTELEVYGVPAG